MIPKHTHTQARKGIRIVFGMRARTNQLFKDHAPSWESLRSLSLARVPSLRSEWSDPRAKRRQFDRNEIPRVKLYRDHAAWCPYCQKVWLQLEEKKVPYVVEKINMRCYGDKPSSYLERVPSGLLPAMELDGKLYTESATIAVLLEEAFPDHNPLLPPNDRPERRSAEILMNLERQLFGAWMQWLTSSWMEGVNKAAFERKMSEVEKALGSTDGPFFLGCGFSLVDVVFVPFLERMAASLLYYKGYNLRNNSKWPNLERWFRAMEERPAYMGTKSDYYTHAHDLPPQLGGCASNKESKPYQDLIDGKAWRLPLEPIGKDSLEPGWPDHPEADCWEAASRILENKDAIVKFGLRGCGRPGPRPVWAELSDPTAIPGVAYERDFDAALRYVVYALLEGVEKVQGSDYALMVGDMEDGLQVEPVIQSSLYLQQRIGVPRDMTYPAARQLRAHLQWLVSELRSE